MQEFHALILRSWDISQDGMPGEKYVIHKLYPIGVDVIVSICENNNGYEIKSSAVANVAGPDETVDGVASTLTEAIKIAETECIWWDEYLEKFEKKNPL